MSKKAIVLFNLGGPDNLAAVKSFLFNLFYDKAIIDLPNPIRYFLAKFISKNREKKAQAIYSKIGGKSPILALTREQASILESKINKIHQETEFKVFVSMRYTSPTSDVVVGEIMRGGYSEILLIPLYPQFSTTTTKSSYNDFIRHIPKFYTGKIKMLCCYPTDTSFIDAHVELIRDKINIVGTQNIKILFSAHGLPQKTIKAGDPYQWQVEQTCNAVMRGLNNDKLRYQICYQSKVGPLKWLGPDIGEAIGQSAEEGKDVMVVPISFVSEHSETLVELDIEYRELAQNLKIKNFYRVPALGINENYIDCLINQCIMLSEKEGDKRTIVTNFSKRRICPKEFCQCIYEE